MNTDVNNTANEVKANFRKAYGMIPADYQAEFREKLKEQTVWSHMTFHNKRKGSTTFTPLELRAVEAAFAAYNIDAWTGEYIKQLSE